MAAQVSDECITPSTTEKAILIDPTHGPMPRSLPPPPMASSATPNAPPTSEQLDHLFRPYKIQASCALKCGRIYFQVFVLLLSWEDEDPRLPVLQEIDQLCDVFERIYHFKVERWKIPSDDSHRRLNHKVLSFVGEDLRDHLKIVYYAGHGRLSYNRQPVWVK
jgi:hypothetical protein